MKLLQAWAYMLVIMAIWVHHLPYLRASLEVRADYYYKIMAKDVGLWE